MNWIKIIFVLSISWTVGQVEASESLSYSGRLVRPDGAPVTGPVDLKIDLFYTNGTIHNQVCTKNFPDVSLSNGVFHLKLDYLAVHCSGIPLSTVLANVPSGQSLAIQVTDVDNSKTYTMQNLFSVPFSIMAVMAKTLDQMGATDGQVLKWNNTLMKWEPGNGVSGAPSGSAGGDLTGTYPNPTISGLSAAKIGGGTVDNTEFGYLNGVTSNIQTQLNSLQSNLPNGTSLQYLRGDKTLQTLDTSVVPENGPWYFTFDRVTGTPLTGYTTGTAVPITAVDTVMGAIGKLEALITANDTAFDNSGVWNKTDPEIYYTDGNVGIGTNNPSAILEISSTTSGLLIPRMNTTQRDNIVAPSVGLQIFNTQTNKLNFFDGAWKELNPGSGVTSITIGAGLTPTGNITTTGSIAVDVGTTANKIVQLDGTGKLPAIDGSQLTNISAAPSGAAGGDLTGTYPNPTIAAGVIVDADVSATAAIAQSKISGLTAALAGKEPVVAAGNPTDYYAGDKTWKTLDTSVVPENGRLYFLESRVRDTLLTGYAGGTAVPLQATDSLLVALGKLEAQITANDTAFDNSGVWSKNLTKIYYTAGNVGVGTNDPSERFQVGDATTSNSVEKLKLISKNDVVLELMADADNVNEDENPYIFMSQDGLVSTQYVIGITGLAGSDPRGNATTDTTSNSLYFGSATATSGSNIQFATEANVRMTIKNTGQIGIGTNDPQSKLDVRSSHDGTAATVLRVGTSGSSMGTDVGLSFVEGSSLEVGKIRTVDEGSGNVSMRFDTYSSGLNQNSMLITGDGRVGIGVNPPNASTRLAVNGNIYVKGKEVSIESDSAGVSGRVNVQGQDDGFYYATQFFVNNDWTKYWMFGHRSLAGERNNFILEEYDGATYGQRFVIEPGGFTGINVNNPTERLDVGGNLRVRGQMSGVSQTGTTAAIDWNNGNVISSTFNCGSNISFANLRDGGTYTLAITDTGTTQCSFNTTTTGSDAATVTYRFKPANAARTATSHTIYTLMRIGSTVYVSWTSGF